MANMKRMNIRVNEAMYEYFKNKSDETGISMTALIYMALEELLQQKKTVEAIPLMQQILELAQVEQLKLNK